MKFNKKLLNIILGFSTAALYCLVVNIAGLDSEFKPKHNDNLSQGVYDNNSAYTVDGKININSADAETLCELPGIGEKMSERIIRYRNENGEFVQIQDIMKINGIGEKTFEQLEDLICIDDEGREYIPLE